MTLDSYFPLFGGFVNKYCVFGECWALSYFLTGPGLSLIFPFCSLTDLLAPRELLAPGSSPQGQAAARAEPGLLPAVAALPHFCTTSPKSRSTAEPQKDRNTGNYGL